MTSVYRMLLRLYPVGFRTRFAEEMEQLLRDQATHGDGVRWVRVSGDLLRSSVVQRWEQGGRTMRTKAAMGLFFAVIVLGGTLLLTGALLEPGSILVAASIFAATGIVFGVAMLLGRRSTEDVYSAHRRRWWFYPAGLIGAVQGGFAILQLVRDPKWENVLALAIIGAFTAAVFIGMGSRNRRTGNWLIAIGVLPMLPMIWWVAPPFISLVVIVMALADNVRLSRARVAA